MRGKTFRRSVQNTSWWIATALVLIAVPVSTRAFADEPSSPTEERQQAERDQCKSLMDTVQTAAQELRDIGETLEGRSWVQRKKLKEITARIEAIHQKLERAVAGEQAQRQ